MVDSPESLRRQARTIASRGDDPNASWSELRSWASGKGPVAMKSAMIEFISLHGASPEAALLMPRLMSDQSLSAVERKEVLALSKQTLQPRPGMEALKPRLGLPAGKGVLRAAEPFRPFHLPSPGADGDARELHLQIREKARLSLHPLSPKPPEIPRFDPTKSPDSVAMGAAMHKGEHLVHSLVEKLRGHARDERPAEKKPKARAKSRSPKAPAKKTPAPKKAPAKKAGKARKPARKAPRQAKKRK